MKAAITALRSSLDAAESLAIKSIGGVGAALYTEWAQDYRAALAVLDPLMVNPEIDARALRLFGTAPQPVTLDCREMPRDGARGMSAVTHELGGPDEVMIFVRPQGFYPIQGVTGVPLTEQAADHAALNPGTLQVEDTRGNVLWRLQ